MYYILKNILGHFASHTSACQLHKYDSKTLSTTLTPLLPYSLPPTLHRPDQLPVKESKKAAVKLKPTGHSRPNLLESCTLEDIRGEPGGGKRPLHFVVALFCLLMLLRF